MIDLMKNTSTDRGESWRLFSMDVNYKTADLTTYKDEKDIWQTKVNMHQGIIFEDDRFPSWSLSRLLDMMPKCIVSEECDCYLHITYHEEGVSVYYDDDWEQQIAFASEENVFTACIKIIEWLIKNDHFNKEYLV